MKTPNAQGVVVPSSVFHNLNFIVQYRRKDLLHGWLAMIAFDVEDLALREKRNCEGANRPWEYRLIRSDGTEIEAPRTEDELLAAPAAEQDVGKTLNFVCKAKRTADPPQDCSWPTCGCDPYAYKVIAALQESGELPPISQTKWTKEILERLWLHLPNIGQMLNVLESEWKHEGCWSKWDQETMDEQRAIHKEVNAIIEGTAALGGEGGGG